MPAEHACLIKLYVSIGPLGKKSSKGSALKNWKTALLACGSNAFSQNTDGAVRATCSEKTDSI